MCIAELRRYRRGRRGGGAGRKRGRVCVASRTVIDTLDVRVRVYARLATQRAHGARARTARGAAIHGRVRRIKLFAIRLVVTLTGYAIARPTVQRTHAGAIGRAA